MPLSPKRSFLIYALAYGVTGATPFLLLPVLTRYLTPSQFGEVTSFLILTGLLANFAGLNTQGFVAARFFKVPAEKFSALLSSSLVTMAVAHGVVLAFVATLFPLISHSLGLPLGYVLLAVLVALFLNFNLTFLAIFQFSGQPWQYLYTRVLQGVIEFSLCLGLLFFASADAGSRIWAYAAAIAASAVWGLCYCAHRRLISPHLEREPVRGLLRFGLPMLPHVGAGMAVTYVDRLMVSSLLGSESLGIYMVAMQVGMTMVALIEPLNKALAPWLFEQLSKGQDTVRRMIVRRTYQLFAALVLLGIAVSIAAYFLFGHLIGAKFAAARMLVPYMVAGFVAQGMYYCVVNYMFYAERTGTLSIVTGSAALAGGLISYASISVFGLPGAAAAFMLNNILLFLLVWLTTSKTVPMPWWPRRHEFS